MFWFFGHVVPVAEKIISGVKIIMTSSSEVNQNFDLKLCLLHQFPSYAPPTRLRWGEGPFHCLRVKQLEVELLSAEQKTWIDSTSCG